MQHVSSSPPNTLRSGTCLVSRSQARSLNELFHPRRGVAATPGDGWVARDIMVLRLRTLLARARGDEDGYLALRDRYRAWATSLDFDGHMHWAEVMP